MRGNRRQVHERVPDGFKEAPERFHQEQTGATANDPARQWEIIIRDAAVNVELWQQELQKPALLSTRSRGDIAPSRARQQAEQATNGTALG